MSLRKALLRCSVGTLALFCLGAAAALAQYPTDECDPSMAPPDAPIEPSLLAYCSSGTHPGADCDLWIGQWDEVTLQSPDLRIGDPFDPSGAPTPRDPRFFFDAAGNRFYTKLYVQFSNAGGGAGGVAPATEVSVDFFYKITSDPGDRDDPTGWLEAGTEVAPGDIDNTYQMNIPEVTGVVEDGALFPGQWHRQQRGVCWSLPAGSQDLPAQFLIRADVQWPEDVPDPPTENTAYAFYDLTSLERLAQIGFAIDLSGSMDDSFSGGTKLQEAREKAALFASLVEDGNQLGVYGFATQNPSNTDFDTSYIATDDSTVNATLTETSQITGIHTVSGDLDRLLTAAAILVQSAHGCTPLGQGVLRARDAFGDVLPPPDAGKAIVLFSDGLQNIRPFVEGASEGPCTSSPPGITISTEKTFTDDNISIYVVYFGPETGWAYDLMWNLQKEADPDCSLSAPSASDSCNYIYGTASELELAAAYYSIRALVDDMLYFDDRGVVSDTAWPEFAVAFDGGVRTATAAVTWPFDNGATQLQLWRKPEGSGDEGWVRCQEAGRQTAVQPETGSMMEVATPTSFEVCRFAPGADSTWEFQVRQVLPTTGSTEYTAAVFSAVQSAQIVASLGNADFRTGETLPIFAQLRGAGAPLTGATVTATVQVPARSFSSTLRKYAGRFKAPGGAGQDIAVVSAYADQLRGFLRRDEGSDELYTYRELSVSLTDDGSGQDAVAGDGVYSGVVPAAETEIAGDYRVTVTADATLASGRTVRRVARLSTVCNVGAPSTDLTDIRSLIDRDPVAGRYPARITLAPADRFGNAAFPGSGSTIQIVPGAGVAALGDLVDNRDTTFTQYLTLDRPDGAEVGIRIDGVDFGTHAIGRGPERTNELSFHLGVALPHGTLGAVASSGPSFGLDLAHRFDQHLALKGELVLDRFDFGPIGDRDLLSLAAYLQYRDPRGLWWPYFETGIGLYDLEDAGSAAGFVAGLGAQRELGSRWALDISLQGHRVGGNLNLSFTRFRIGGVYRY